MSLSLHDPNVEVNFVGAYAKKGFNRFKLTIANLGGICSGGLLRLVYLFRVWETSFGMLEAFERTLKCGESDGSLSKAKLTECLFWLSWVSQKFRKLVSLVLGSLENLFG